MPPSDPGTYALLLSCRSQRRIAIGRLRNLALEPGYYVYVGSAFGPGGIRARVEHHRRRAARPHWHIDYLRRYARLEAVDWQDGERCEHEWAAQVASLPGALVALPGFGSSDCRCATHLFHFDHRPVLASRPC